MSNQTAILLWGAALVGSIIVAERVASGCTRCKSSLSILEAIRSATCPACERSLQFIRKLT